MNARDGFAVFDYDPGVAAWAAEATDLMKVIVQDTDTRSRNMRHGDTWFIGLDMLPNAADGSIGGTPLPGAWRGEVADLPLHRAQVSVVYPGYPRRGPADSEAQHRYRVRRGAAHVDGLLPLGPQRRRFAREYHAYILAVPLNEVRASPTMVWQGSHRIMQAALVQAIGTADPAAVDVTEAYQAARREVFETCRQVPLYLRVGETALIHRFALHGTAPWDPAVTDDTGEGRMIAFFRPECAGGSAEWLVAP